MRKTVIFVAVCMMLTVLAASGSVEAAPARVDGVIRDVPGGDVIGDGWVVGPQHGMAIRGKITIHTYPGSEEFETLMLDVEYYADLPYGAVFAVDGPLQYIYHGTATRQGTQHQLQCIVEAAPYGGYVGRAAHITIWDDRLAGIQPGITVYFDGYEV